MTVIDAGRSAARAAEGFRRLDRVLLAGAAILGVLALFDPPQAWASLEFLGRSLLFILPFLLISVLLAAWLKATSADRLVGLALGRAPVLAVLLAALAGALSPFCSCGVVPLIAGLLAGGVPLAPVAAFWLASPIMDPEMFVLTAAVLGLDFALAKTLAAFGLGLFGGLATLAVTRSGGFGEPLRAGLACGSGCGSVPMAGGGLRWRFWREPARRRAFASETAQSAFFLGKWLALAFLLESLMIRWLPAELVAGSFDGASPWALPLAVVLGVPAYLNGYAAIPLVDQLMTLGMAPGPALAFLVAGGVTSIPAAAAVFALVRWPLFLWYLGLSLVGALLVGLAYSGFLTLF